MSCEVLIVGLPPAAGCPSTETWRAAAALLERQLHDRFGPAVTCEFLELFTPDFDGHPEIEALVAGGAVPPLVLIDGTIYSSGGKLRLSAIGRAVADRLAAPVGTSGKELVS